MRRSSLLFPLFFVLPVFFFVSCSSLPFFPRKSWSLAGLKKRGPTVRLENVSVDKPGGWISIEEEMINLTPLLFLERGYLVSADPEKADYAVEVRAWEREYTQGWKTKRSVMMEVRLWHERGPDAQEYRETPLAAGRAAYYGKKSLVSSRKSGSMLKSALRRALRALPRRAQAKDAGEETDS
jgi:hypothetical protein